MTKQEHDKAALRMMEHLLHVNGFTDGVPITPSFMAVMEVMHDCVYSNRNVPVQLSTAIEKLRRPEV